jgi:prophage maintenance system killer protein
MEAFLLLNGFEVLAAIDEQERLMLELAAGQTTRERLTEWIAQHLTPSSSKDSAG